MKHLFALGLIALSLNTYALTYCTQENFETQLELNNQMDVLTQKLTNNLTETCIFSVATTSCQKLSVIKDNYRKFKNLEAYALDQLNEVMADWYTLYRDCDNDNSPMKGEAIDGHNKINKKINTITDLSSGYNNLKMKCENKISQLEENCN